MCKNPKKFKTSTKILLTAIYNILLSSILIYSITSNTPIIFCCALTIGIIVSLIIFYFFGWFELSHKNLFNQPLFMISIFIPLYLFLSIGFWSWQGHSLNFTSDGFNNFLTISKLPLLFLAAAVPLTSIVNNIHRTIQTEKQISEAEKKNLADSYYTHFKHTLELLKSITSGKTPISYDDLLIEFSFHNPISFYHKIYPTNSPSSILSYTPNPKLIKEITENWEAIKNSISDINKISKKWKQGKKHAFYVPLALIKLYTIENAVENLIRSLKLSDLSFPKRPVYEYKKWNYRGLTYSASSLNILLGELNLVCNRLIDIISPFDEEIKEATDLDSKIELRFGDLGLDPASYYQNESSVRLLKEDGGKMAAYKLKRR